MGERFGRFVSAVIVGIFTPLVFDVTFGSAAVTVVVITAAAFAASEFLARLLSHRRNLRKRGERTGERDP